MEYIINEKDLEYLPFPGEIPAPAKEKYEGATIGQAGMKLGSQKLGYNITVLPAGKSAFPFHNHHVNEEMFYVLEGEGSVRIGSETYPIQKGDFIMCPPGGTEVAHQITNTSGTELRFMAVSTKESPEIAEYPDTGKFGVLSKEVRFLGKLDQSLGYWDGE